MSQEPSIKPSEPSESSTEPSPVQPSIEPSLQPSETSPQSFDTSLHTSLDPNLQSNPTQPITPVEGALYYLVHLESNQFVHPWNGSDNPPQDTHLVFHRADQGRLALQFCFVNRIGLPHLQHFSSGLLVHPRGGTPGANVRLVLWREEATRNTQLTMVTLGNRTFLAHFDSFLPVNTRPLFIVHPLGGSVSPPDHTPLVFSTEQRPGVSIVLRPAENFRILNMEFDRSAIDALPGDTMVVDDEAHNKSFEINYDTEITVTFSSELVNTHELTLSQALGVSIGRSFTAGISVASATASVEFSFEFSRSETRSTSRTEGVQYTITRSVSIPPRHAVRLELIASRRRGRVPFVATAENDRGVRFTFSGVMDMVFFLDSRSVLRDIPLRDP